MRGSRLRVIDLGCEDFERSFARQEDLVPRRKRGAIPDTLLLVEHLAVYTLGRNASAANVLITEPELLCRGIRVIRTTRGGQVTYHGPGQLVVYPIIALGPGRGPVWYVDGLEEVLIQTLADFGVAGRRDSRNRGVWVGDEKIAAIGVRIAQHVTMHGFSLNVCVNLRDYDGIIPCGISDRGVTSLDRLTGDATMAAARERVVKHFRGVFGYE